MKKGAANKKSLWRNAFRFARPFPGHWLCQKNGLVRHNYK
jgi:hypothetical protein